MGQTVVEKIAQSHATEGPRGRPVRAGDFLSIRPRHVMTHDNTSAVLSKFEAIGATGIFDPVQPVFCIDHDIQNTSEENLRKYRAIEAFAKTHGIDFFPAGSGIGHQVMCEQLYVVPGSFVVAADSHANMYGALGAVGTPIVRTDAAVVWATGEFWWQIPRTVEVILTGALPPGATGKDVIVTLCGIHGGAETLNAAVEFTGPGAATLSMDERMAISNMTTEWGPLVGFFPADQVTLAWIQERRRILASHGTHRGDAFSPVLPDADAAYAGRITLDLGQVTPHVSGPDTVRIATPLSELAAKRIPIRKAYLVSCVNSRVSDIEAAASVLRGKRIAPSVQLYVAAASKEVQETSERSGAWQALLDAGAKPLPPGCGPCIGLGAGLLEPGEVGISATNRNFKGRMGSRDAECYLASPAVVAASALAGYIRGPEGSPDGRRLAPRFEALAGPPLETETVDLLPGFAERIRGRLVFLPQDSLDTDGIYGKEYTYRDDVGKETMAEVAMANYDPGFRTLVRAGDVLVGAYDFGTGSSREQAVTALQVKGIALLIAGSYSQTYLRNAFNNGLLCIEAPAFVDRLRDLLRAEVVAGKKTIVPGDEMEVAFATARLTYRGETFAFPALAKVAQSLYVAGGAVSLARRKLGLA